MSGLGPIREIVETYLKHGWQLRRVLLSDAARSAISPDASELFGGVEVSRADIDAAWFSRPPADGETAWELRDLGELPYALLVHVDESSPDIEAALAESEAKLGESIAKKHQA